jgi:transposase
MTKIGIDIAKLTFVVARYLPTKKVKFDTYAYTDAGMSDFIEGLPTDAHVVMEYTGQYELRLAQSLVKSGFQVSLVSGQVIRHYAKTKGFTNKTDKQDARAILMYAEKESESLRFYRIPSDDIAKMKQYRSLLGKIKKDKQALENQLYAHLQNPQADKYVTASFENRIVQVKEEIDALILQINTIVDSTKDFDSSIPDSVPGIGKAVADEMVMAVKTFQDFNEDAIDSMIKLVGLSPSSKESGTSVRGSRSLAKGGFAALRKSLYMGAVSTVTRKGSKNVFREMYLDLRERGKCFKVAITAIMAKMARVAFTLMAKNQTYDEAKHRAAAGRPKIELSK